MTKGGAAKKPLNAKKVAKIVDDKTFGLKNKGGKKNQQLTKQMQATLAGNNRKPVSKEPQSKKVVKAQRDEELARLGITKTVPKKTSAVNPTGAASSSANGELIVEHEEVTEGKLLEDTIEEMRRNLGANLTPVTPESFAIWYAKKKKEKAEKRLKKMSRREKDIALGRVAMTGRELFDRKRNLFVDDEHADDDTYEQDEDLLSGLEEQMRMDAEVNETEFDMDKFKAEKERILVKLREERKLGKTNAQVQASAAASVAASSSSSAPSNTTQDTESSTAPGNEQPKPELNIDESLFTEEDLPDEE